MGVTAQTYLEFPGWERAPEYIGEVLDRERPESVLEIGAGRDPTLSVADVTRRGMRYTVNDIAAEELALADPAYETFCCDMSQPLPADLRACRFDLIFSRMVNEHVADGERYHANVYELLNPGGVAVHLFATFYSLPFIVNRLAPDAITERILALAGADNPDLHEKFPARYRWCRGPGRTAIARYRRLGYEVERYHGYFGHGYYIRVAPLHRLELAKARWLAEHPIPALTSYAAVVLRKPRP